jgi:hypothetical protein
MTAAPTTGTLPIASPAPAGASPGAGPALQLAQRTLRIAVPAASAAALVYYFGYIYSQTFYDELGLNVDALGLGTADFAIRSSQVLIGAFLVVTLALAGAALLHLALVAVLTRVPNPGAARAVAVAVMLAGGVMLIGWPSLVSSGPVGGRAARLAGALGGLYGLRLWWVAASSSRTWARVSDALEPRGRAFVGALLILAVTGVIAYGSFELTRAAAQEVGRDRAAWVAQNCTNYPLITVVSTVDLRVSQPGLHTVLQAGEAGDFRFRTDGLRLLNERGGRYLVWSAARSPLHAVFALPADGRVRVEPASAAAASQTECPVPSSP